MSATLGFHDRRNPGVVKRPEMDELQVLHKDELEALHRQYEGRLRELSDRLRYTYAHLNNDETLETLQGDPASREFVPQRIKEIVESSLSSERENHLEHLMQKAAAMDAREKELLRCLDEKEAEHARQLEECRLTLLSTEDKTSSTSAPPGVAAAPMIAPPSSTVLPTSPTAGNSIQIQQIIQELQALQATCSYQRHEIDTKSSECEDYKRRYEESVRERGSGQEELLASVTRERALRQQIAGNERGDEQNSHIVNVLEAEKKRLEDELEKTESDRLQLKQKYVDVGEKFEKFIQMEEKAKGEAAEAVAKRLKAAKTRAMQYKKTNLKLEADFLELEHLLKVERTLVMDKDAEIKRLASGLEQEREHWQSQLRSHEFDRKLELIEQQNTAKSKEQETLLKSLVEQRGPTSKAEPTPQPDVISIDRHHTLLQERIQTQEAKHQDQIKTLTQKHDLELKDKLRDAEETRQRAFTAVLAQIRAGVKALETSRSEHVKQKESLLVANNKLKKSMDLLESQNTENYKQRQQLALNIEEANENIGKLKELLEGEIDKRKSLESKIKEADFDFSSHLHNLQSHQAEQQARKHAEDFDQLRSEFETLQESRQSLQNETVKLQFDLAQMTKKYEAQIGDNQELKNTISEFENQIRNAEQCDQKRCHVIKKLGDLFKKSLTATAGHSQLLRNELNHVKDKVTTEMSAMASYVQMAIGRIGAKVTEMQALEDAQHRLDADLWQRERSKLTEELCSLKDVIRETQQAAEEKTVNLQESEAMTAKLRYQIESIVMDIHSKLGLRGFENLIQSIRDTKGAAPGLDEQRKSLQDDIQESVALLHNKAIEPIQKTCEDSIQNYRRRAEDKEASMAECIKKCQDLESVILQKDAELSSKNSMAANLESTLAKTTKECSRAIEANRQEAHAALRKQLKQLQKEAEALQQQYHQDIELRETQLQNMLKEKLTDQLREAESRENTLTRQLELVYAQYHEEVKDMQDQASTSEKAVRDAQEKLSATVKELEITRRERRQADLASEAGKHELQALSESIKKKDQLIRQLTEEAQNEFNTAESTRQIFLKQKNSEIESVKEEKNREIERLHGLYNHRLSSQPVTATNSPRRSLTSKRTSNIDTVLPEGNSPR
eukprot:GHVQ01013167.1.p1 GENE.GHVQ01013167.1~~GHVQ01013167.1.p1  ORF type:complete len:1129 (+),score=187.56 GHVQ01013167.1:338-3724(+)